MVEHKIQSSTYGIRNRYSKADHDAIFMRVKENPMLSGRVRLIQVNPELEYFKVK